MKKMIQSWFYAATRSCPENHKEPCNCFQGATSFVKAHAGFGRNLLSIPECENQ